MTAAYDDSDPRSRLVTRSATTPPVRAQGDAVLPFQHYELGQLEPDVTTEPGSPSWVVRAQNVVAVWTDLSAGDSIERTDIDETMVLILHTTGTVEVTAGGEWAELQALSIAILPPGPWRIVAQGAARVLRLHATSALDLVNLARNRHLYEPAPESIAVHAPWPAPTGGNRLRVYRDLDSIAPSSDRMGRIFRNRHVMVNVLYPRVGPRDPRTLSPHDHDDFEQLSVAYEGSYLHHIRAHWGQDRLQWRDDEHAESTSPSIAVIPPPLIHTSEAIGSGTNCMIDVFAGPRADFSAKAGWVLNAADYPVLDEGSL